MLATFYAKALDADLDNPILGDRWAKEIVDRIDYDWSTTAITPGNSPSVTTRSAHFASVPWYYRATLKGMMLTPSLRYMAQYHRYAY